MANCVFSSPSPSPSPIQFHTHTRSFSESLLKFPSPPAFRPRLTRRIFCNYDGSNRNNQTQSSSTAVQLYRDFERYNSVLSLLPTLVFFYGFLIYLSILLLVCLCFQITYRDRKTIAECFGWFKRLEPSRGFIRFVYRIMFIHYSP